MSKLVSTSKVTYKQIPNRTIAWSLKKSPVILAIPGTGKVAHLEENTAAAGLVLTDDEFAAIEALGKR